MTDLAQLLAACRAGPGELTPRHALRDAVGECDGYDSPACGAVLAMRCEVVGCGVPDGTELVCRDAHGKWHKLSDVRAMNATDGVRLFLSLILGFPEAVDPRLAFYRLHRWHLVCPQCRRSLIAHKAADTRAARRRAEPNLFTGVE